MSRRPFPLTKGACAVSTHVYSEAGHAPSREPTPGTVTLKRCARRPASSPDTRGGKSCSHGDCSIGSRRLHCWRVSLKWRRSGSVDPRLHHRPDVGPPGRHRERTGEPRRRRRELRDRAGAIPSAVPGGARRTVRGRRHVGRALRQLLPTARLRLREPRSTGVQPDGHHLAGCRGEHRWRRGDRASADVRDDVRRPRHPAAPRPRSATSTPSRASGSVVVPNLDAGTLSDRGDVCRADARYRHARGGHPAKRCVSGVDRRAR